LLPYGVVKGMLVKVIGGNKMEIIKWARKEGWTIQLTPEQAEDLYYSLEAALKDSFPPNNSQFEIHIEEDR